MMECDHVMGAGRSAFTLTKRTCSISEVYTPHEEAFLHRGSSNSEICLGDDDPGPVTVPENAIVV